MNGWRLVKTKQEQEKEEQKKNWNQRSIIYSQIKSKKGQLSTGRGYQQKGKVVFPIKYKVPLTPHMAIYNTTARWCIC